MIIEVNLSSCVGKIEIELTNQDVDMLSHAICLGIRKGLFGKDASENVSIN